MPFQPGTSGNALGRPKRYWITEKKRVREARKSFDKLCAIRDEKIKEQVFDKEGKSYDVVPSAKVLHDSCKTIMAYAVGLPTQQVELTGAENEPFAFNVIIQQNGNQNGVGLIAGTGGFSLHYGGGDGNGG